ncbi:hypothetical protein Vadar_001534 [Vaccinium darrowii]|uniref:Uncharacterized protein n=1 Tax=Vaccinium darrowii TaxID=229202 RepID=A0ACB7YAT8_9ERIC|nr:hypothetical protein Vadar_001534 [Vaccinium darrowii]
MTNITGNDLDCSSEETEVFIIVTNLIKQMQTTCIMALVVVHVALESYYSRHESRFTELNPYQEQINHINRLVRRSDTTCVEQLRMDRNCFMRLCMLVQTVGGLSHSRRNGLKIPTGNYYLVDAGYTNGEDIEGDADEDGSMTVNKDDKSPPELPKKKAKVSETLMAGLSNFADKLVSSLETSNATLEKLGGRMGYAHDLSAKRGVVKEELGKLPISTVDRVKAALGITKDAQTVDHFFSLKTEEEKLILV